MVITDELLEQIIETIRENPTKPLVLPRHCYDKRSGVVMIWVDGLPVRLHRHLWSVLRPDEPLGWDITLHDMSLVRGNVNPFLYQRGKRRGRSIATHCRYGHAYADNEMPDNAGRWRCATCYREWRASRRTGKPQVNAINAAKTHCPKNHPYDEENTIINADGKRRCRQCIRDRRKRKETS